MNTFELALKTKELPTKIEELVPLSFMGQTAVNFYKNQISLFDNLGISEEQRKKTLKDGQDAGVMLLEIESKIGELCRSVPMRPVRKKDGKLAGQEKTVKTEIPHRKRKIAYKIYENPKDVQDTIEEAIANDDIPTKTAVLNKIKYNKEKERREKAEKNKHEPSKLTMSLEEQQAILSLEKMITTCPKEWPKNWNQETFQKAKGYANILIKRLEVFNG